MTRSTLLDALRQIRPDTVAESLLTPELRAKINASTADLTALASKVENLITLEQTDSATIEQLQVIIDALGNKDGSHDSMIAALNELANAASSGLSAEVIARIAGDAALQAAIDTANAAATSLAQKVGVIEAQVALQAQAIAAAQSTADSAVQAAAAAAQSAQAAQTSANAAQSSANTAQASADAAQAGANAAQSTADNAQTSANAANTLAAQADGKADQALTGNALTATAAAAAQVAADAAKAAADAAMAAALAIKVPELKQAKLPVDGVSQVFALPADADETKFISVFDNGQLIWMNGDDYTLVGRDIHLNYIPAADRDRVYIHYYNKIVAAPTETFPSEPYLRLYIGADTPAMTLVAWNQRLGTAYTGMTSEPGSVTFTGATDQTIQSEAFGGLLINGITDGGTVTFMSGGPFYGSIKGGTIKVNLPSLQYWLDATVNGMVLGSTITIPATCGMTNATYHFSGGSGVTFVRT